MKGVEDNRQWRFTSADEDYLKIDSRIEIIFGHQIQICPVIPIDSFQESITTRSKVFHKLQTATTLTANTINKHMLLKCEALSVC